MKPRTNKPKSQKARSRKHADAICPLLTVNDLFIFQDLYKRLINREDWTEIRNKLPTTDKVINRIVANVKQALNISEPGRDFLRKAAQESGAPTRFHAGISKLLKELTTLVHECNQAPRVNVQGSEFCILSLLPRVLKESAFLTKHPDAVLDIRRARWSRMLANLEKGRIDMALGSPAPSASERIKREILLTVERVIIYHKDHRFACKKEGFEIGLDDLGTETVFVLSGDAVPSFCMEEELLPPVKPGRRIYLDSISHMYQYVYRDLGVAIGYDLRFSPFPRDEVIKETPLRHRGMPAAVFCLYTRMDRDLPPDARDLKDAILQTFRKPDAG